jgi:hypothetical protein
MNERDVEKDIFDFFRYSTTPEPSARLREAVVRARLAPAGRAATFRTHRTAFAFAGLAATFVLAAASVLVLVNVRRASTPATVAACSTASAAERTPSAASATPDTSAPSAASTAPDASPNADASATANSSAAAETSATPDASAPDATTTPDVSSAPTPGASAVATESSATLDGTPTAAVPAVAHGTFSRTGSMSIRRVTDTATLLCDGRVLIAGGGSASPGSAYLTSAEIYDPSTGSFTMTGSMTTARVTATATLLPSGKVLIAGGMGAGGIDDILASAELYDPATGGFASTGSMATPRFLASAVLLADGRVLIAGGVDPDMPLATAEIYDPVSGRFSPTGSMAGGMAGAPATLLHDGRVLIVGLAGDPDHVDANGQPASAYETAQIYDPKTGTFNRAAKPVSDASSQMLSPLADGRVLLAGGLGNDPAVTSAEVFDPAKGTFSATGSMTIGREQGTTTLLTDGRVLVTGGYAHDATSLSSTTSSFNGTASAELYDPTAGSFSPTGSLSLARGDQTATLLLDGRVLIVGGEASGGATATAELYQP